MRNYMDNHINKNVLVTTQGWFVAPDGKEYRAVFGKLIGVHEAGKTLGFIPNRSHANWFIEIGNMIIMGCQVMYFTQTDEPNLSTSIGWNFDSSGSKYTEYERSTLIYNANI